MTEILSQPNPDRKEIEIKRLFDLAKATTMLLSDRPSEPVDAIFFFGRSYFDAGKHDLYKTAVDLIKDKKAQYVFLPGDEGFRMGGSVPRESRPGISLETDRLTKMGVDRDKIFYCPHPIPETIGFNTKTEGDAFLKTAEQRGFKRVIVLTQPHQIVRAMLGVVKTIDDQELDIDIWCSVPQSTDWQVRVKGSQGKERKPRAEHIPDETGRILKYQDQGDLASFEELFAYLEKRDSRNPRKTR